MEQSKARPFDWTAPRFLPVEIRTTDEGATLSAGGESVHFRGRLFAADADVPLETHWTLERREFLVLSLELKALSDTSLRQVTWFAGEWSGFDERQVSSTRVQDTVLFLRRGAVSFFLSLDFPCSRIAADGISYQPMASIAAGQPHRCHTLTVGACRRSFDCVGPLDRAEIEAVSAYVEQRFPLRFNRPLFLSCCITNRMTECREGRVFYSMADNPTLYLNPRLLAEDTRLCGRIGIEYFQIFEGMFDWPDEKRTGAALRRLWKLARRLGVRLGDYVNPQGLYCWHYNYFNRSLVCPEWHMRDSAGKEVKAFCLGHTPYADYLRERVVAHNRERQQQMICFDFLHIQPCFAESHTHPPGDVYQQVRGLVRLMEALNALHPEFLVWTNSGNWIDLMPKLVWYNPNVYLTDPHVREYAPSLNSLKFLGDGRREQMVTTHERWFVPYRMFTNCEYYAFPRSRVPDRQVFEYSFLQGLAVTPNICPAEIRPLLNRISAAEGEACLAFMRRWLDFIRAHFDVWQHTFRAGDPPGLGAAELYAHTDGERGFLCLVNQNPFPRTIGFRLDGSVGLSSPGPFLLREAYPRECPIAEQPLPWAARGDEIQCHLPPESVRFIEVRPLAAAEGLQVYGLPARVRRRRGGYKVTLCAPQGETVALGLVLPPGERLRAVQARQVPSVPMYTFPAAARIVAVEGNLARLEVTFPRGRAPRAISRWKVSPGDVEVTLPVPGLGFLGGLVYGAWSEDYEVELTLSTEPCPAGDAQLPATLPGEKTPPPAVPAGTRHTFMAEFDLPFIEPVRFGTMPDLCHDTTLELCFADCRKVRSVAARLNGAPADVRRYPYPRKQDWHSWYIDLTGVVDPGTVRLEVDVEWQA
jgi:hypothetical protein